VNNSGPLFIQDELDGVADRQNEHNKQHERLDRMKGKPVPHRASTLKGMGLGGAWRQVLGSGGLRNFLVNRVFTPLRVVFLTLPVIQAEPRAFVKRILDAIAQMTASERVIQFENHGILRGRIRHEFVLLLSQFVLSQEAAKQQLVPGKLDAIEVLHCRKRFRYYGLYRSKREWSEPRG
jgi:hypothetical protein